MIWKMESAHFEGWGQEGWAPQDFDPVERIDGSARKIGQVLFHPTASLVLASASGDHTVKLWDLSNTDSPKSVLGGHADAIQSLAFNPTGTLLATTSRDRKLRLFDPRAGGEAVRITDGHEGIKSARVTWMGDMDRIATTGFSKRSDRQVAIWETGGLTNVKMIGVDLSSGVLMPFWSENSILFLGERPVLLPSSFPPLMVRYGVGSWKGVRFSTSQMTNGNNMPLLNLQGWEYTVLRIRVGYTAQSRGIQICRPATGDVLPPTPCSQCVRVRDRPGIQSLRDLHRTYCVHCTSEGGTRRSI